MSNISYGAQTKSDIAVLEAVMQNYADGPMRFLEIGVHVGSTARGIKEFCDANKIKLEYWGMDVKKPDVLFEGANFVQGDSIESFHLVPNQFDIILSDGCHCFNHVALELFHYTRKVAQWGYLLMHDTAPHVQQTMKDPHGPNIPEFHNSVLLAMSVLRFPWPMWKLYQESCEPEVPWGGMRAYQKTIAGLTKKPQRA